MFRQSRWVFVVIFLCSTFVVRASEVFIIDEVSVENCFTKNDNRVYWKDFSQKSGLGLYFADTSDAEIRMAYTTDRSVVGCRVEIVAFKYKSNNQDSVYCYEGWMKILKGDEILHYDMIYAKSNCAFSDEIDTKAAIFNNGIFVKVKNGVSTFYNLNDRNKYNDPTELTKFEFGQYRLKELLGKETYVHAADLSCWINKSNVMTISELFGLETTDQSLFKNFFACQIVPRRGDKASLIGDYIKIESPGQEHTLQLNQPLTLILRHYRVKL